MPLARRPAGIVLNLPFQGWFLPLIRGQPMATYLRHIRLRILVTLHEFTARISSIIYWHVLSNSSIEKRADYLL